MSQTTEISDERIDQGLPPWQFFLLCGMLGATAVVIVATGQSIANILILSATIVAASFVGLGAYRMLVPLVSAHVASAPVVAGGRTRAALEREKTLALRAIKELEFDFAMGKVAQADFDEMGGRLRRRAIGLMQQLDANGGYRDQIEHELASLVRPQEPKTPGTPDLKAPSPQDLKAPSPQDLKTPSPQDLKTPSPQDFECAACGTTNDADARFCKQCGTSLRS